MTAKRTDLASERRMKLDEADGWSRRDIDTVLRPFIVRACSERNTPEVAEMVAEIVCDAMLRKLN